MHTFSVFFFFLQFEFLLCFCFVLFRFFSLIFQADTNSILFYLVVENLILHTFLIIMIIMPCSGMFRNVRNVPCSRFYRRPIITDRTFIVRLRSSFSTSNAENRHCQIKWNKWWNKSNYRNVDRKISLLWYVFVCWYLNYSLAVRIFYDQSLR